MRVSRALGAVLALGVVACGRVPDLVFVDELDAQGPQDGSADSDAGAADAAFNDAADGGLEQDAATCPIVAPEYATSCCGSVPCFGADCSAACSECAKCAPLQLCCPTSPTKVVCKPNLRCN